MKNPINYFRESLTNFNSKQMGSICFNLSAFGWIGMNLAMGPYGYPAFVPCAYLQPNFFNLLSAAALLSGAAIGIKAIKMGNLAGPAIALTFLWSVLATLLRQCGVFSQ